MGSCAVSTGRARRHDPLNTEKFNILLVQQSFELDYLYTAHEAQAARLMLTMNHYTESALMLAINEKSEITSGLFNVI